MRGAPTVGMPMLTGSAVSLELKRVREHLGRNVPTVSRAVELPYLKDLVKDLRLSDLDM